MALINTKKSVLCQFASVICHCFNNQMAYLIVQLFRKFLERRGVVD
jgi:hypothetical protein